MKNVGNQTLDGSHWLLLYFFHYCGSQLLVAHIFQNIFFVLKRWKKFIQVCNEMRVSKQWQFLFLVNYPFKLDLFPQIGGVLQMLRVKGRWPFSLIFWVCRHYSAHQPWTKSKPSFSLMQPDALRWKVLHYLSYALCVFLFLKVESCLHRQHI